MENALSEVLYVMKKMEETFRPRVTGIFKHLPPECQKSRNNEVSQMDDDVCGKICAGENGKLLLRKYTGVG